MTGWRLADAATAANDGAAISRWGFPTAGWTPAVVPGTVLTSLVQAGRYPEPLYGLNNLLIPESLSRTSYWYRTEFTAPQGRAWLRLDGVNYVAHVWVNGALVGDVKGAFARGLFDVTRLVKPGERAAVAVQVMPPNHPGTPHEQTLAGGTGRNGGATGADGVTFAATVGWDWIPGIRDRDMGLWQGVALRSTGPVTILDPVVRTDLPLPRLDSAEVAVSATLRNDEDRPVKGVLEGRIEGTGLSFRIPTTVEPGAHEVSKTLTLPKPKLWWPAGYGEPNLYRLKLRFVAGKAESDAVETGFGVREMSYFRAGSPDLTLHVNGVPVLCRGGNWGIDEAMKRSPIERLRAQMRMHRDANLNMVRNWVGQSTQEDFYRAADEYGILVWDDFWLANPSDGPVPEDNDLFLANAREKILRYRNHPSIALWCGRNEANPPPILDAGMAALVKELDPQRFYQRHSAAENGVTGGGPYGNAAFTRYFTYGGAFHTEVGAPAIPTLASIRGMMPERDWWPINDDWAYHDLTRGAQRGDGYLALLGQRYGEVTGLKDFARKGAMLTYETYRAMFEGRGARLFAPVSGTLLWMSNPAQPSFVWQLYHHDLDPTAAMFGSKVANEPVHVQVSPDGTVQVVNSTPKPVPGARIETSLYDANGRVGEPNLQPIDIPASGTARLHKPLLPDLPVVRLRLLDAKGRLLSENVYWSGLRDVAIPAQSLPGVTLEGSARRTGKGMAVTLKNPSKAVALLVHLSLRDKNGNRVLPAFPSDNYVHVFPGESRKVEIEGAGGTQVFVDGWNLAGVKGPGLRLDP